MAVQLDFYSFPPSLHFFIRGLLKCTATGERAFFKAKKLVKYAVSPAVLLRRLSLFSKTEDKFALADHVDTQLAMHMELAEDENPDLRYALAENHNISRDILIKLVKDSNPYVAARAAKTLARIGMNDTDISSWQSCRTAE